MEEKNLRYRKMRNLRDNLDELFRLCGAEVQPVEIHYPAAAVRLLERIISDGSVCGYLDELNKQAKDALKELKNKQLEHWNSEQTEAELERLEKEKELFEDKWEKKLAEEQALKSELAKARDGQRQAEAKARQAEKTESELVELKNKQLALLRELIELRDNLYARREWVKLEDADNSNALKLVEGELRQTKRLMEQVGVTVMEDNGEFDSTRHTVVERIPTDDESLVNQIASVFRPGYLFDGEVLRGQEVVVYVKD